MSTYTRFRNENSNMQPINQKSVQSGRNAGARAFGADLTNVHHGAAQPKATDGAINKPMSSRVRVFDSTSESRMGQMADATPQQWSASDRFPQLASPRMDAPHADDPQYATEFIKDIIDNLRDMEGKYHPAPNYLERQTDINSKMRSILVDWLVDVHYKFKFFPETLYLATNLVDRFLAHKLVTRAKLQLVGVAAMLIASKYEEIYAPEVRDFVYISARAYTRQEILRMERLVLDTLDYHLTVPTPFSFMRRFQRAAGGDDTVNNLAHFFLELSLQNYNMLQHMPSKLTASAMYLAQKYSGKEWSSSLQHYTQYSEDELLDCAREMNENAISAADHKLQAVYKKFSSSKLGAVAQIPRRHPLTL